MSDSNIKRDPRLDLTRGLALSCLYVDHLPGNFFSRFSLHAYGFNDAAEVFVIVSGIAAGLAYCMTFEDCGWVAGIARIMRRIVQVYATHLLLIVACGALFWIAARRMHAPELLLIDQYVHFSGPIGEEIRHALTLRLQPHYLNILPLYVLLLAALPMIVLLLRIHPSLLLSVSLGLWLIPRTLGWNLPSDLHSLGWFFNPLAWQLLFVVGVVWGRAHKRGWRLPHHPAVAAVAVCYCAFALIAAAPWIKIPAFAGLHIIPNNWITPLDKQQLSLLKLADVLALAYVAAYFVGRSAKWLDTAGARFFRTLGRASLSVFAVSAILDAVGWIIWNAGGRSPVWQFALIVLGMIVMWVAARLVELASRQVFFARFRERMALALMPGNGHRPV